MGKANQALLAFNRGIISKLGLARIDVARVALSAEIQTNWFSRLLGSMMLRPGLKYIGESLNNAKAFYNQFVFSKTQTALLEFTENNLRIRINDILLTRPGVSSTITNGDFNGSLTGWTDNDGVGASSTWISGNYMQLVGTGVNSARRTQLVTTSSGGIEHSVKIVIERGPVKFKIGVSSDSDEYLSETTLGTGTHSLSFTPQGAFYINFSSYLKRITLVKSIEIEAAGVVILPSPYDENQLPLVRTDQSLDVIYLCGGGIQQRKIERRGDGRSWSIVLYEPEDGPVGIQNTTPATLAAGALSGNTTLTASIPLFKSTNVGSIFKLVSVGQNVEASISAANNFTNHIIVRGIGDTRKFTVVRSGTWNATVTLERSFDEGVSWETATTYTTNNTVVYDDGLDNQIVWYRIGIKTGDYTSGTAILSLSYSLGSITGYVRVTGFIGPQSVNVEVLKELGSTNPTTKWSQGDWSDLKGWPSGVALSEGRLFFGGRSKIIGSISDAYESFDDEISGDSGLISRDLGNGAISNVSWLVSLYRLFIGTDTAVKTIKTSSFDEPMTPTNFRVVEPSTQSCALVSPVKLDKKAIFIQGAGTRVFELTYDQSTIDYIADELTKAAPEIGEPSIIKILIQRQPETMVHCIRSDGKVAILIYDSLENLKGWCLLETNGEVEDGASFSGDSEDSVYYSIKRIINGQTKRYLEKFALQSECQGGILNKQADSFIIYEGVATNVISGLNHLEGEEVIVWADGKDLSPDVNGVQTTYTVTSGSITLNEEVENAIVGISYESLYKSSKLAYASNSPLGQTKGLNSIGVILDNTHSHGLKYSSNGIDYDDLPRRSNVTGAIIPYNTILTEADLPMISLGGSWSTDSRLYLKAKAPRPCTLLACEIGITTNDTQ